MTVVKCVPKSSSIFIQYIFVTRSTTPASPTSLPHTHQFDIPFHSPNIAILNYRTSFNQESTAAHELWKNTGTMAPFIESNQVPSH